MPNPAYRSRVTISDDDDDDDDPSTPIICGMRGIIATCTVNAGAVPPGSTGM